jgi:enamine deaminase RidA (YjgF/YER057c/UK114 family)/rhodanese-related sulfurtransferase
MEIRRFDDEGRYAQMVVCGDSVHLAGQVADDWNADIAAQTAQVLARVDDLLQRAGTSRRHILSMNVWLADLADYATFNSVFDEWVDPKAKPARATVQAALIDPRLRVEVMLVAARPRPRTAAELVEEARAATPQLSFEQAVELHGSDDVVFVDVREAEEYAAGHIPGALHVPRGLLEFEIEKLADSNESPFTGRRAIMVCGSGSRAALATDAARRLGVDAVLLRDGHRGWAGAGGPVTS